MRCYKQCSSREINEASIRQVRSEAWRVSLGSGSLQHHVFPRIYSESNCMAHNHFKCPQSTSTVSASVERMHNRPAPGSRESAKCFFIVSLHMLCFWLAYQVVFVVSYSDFYITTTIRPDVVYLEDVEVHVLNARECTRSRKNIHLRADIVIISAKIGCASYHWLQHNKLVYVFSIIRHDCSLSDLFCIVQIADFRCRGIVHQDCMNAVYVCGTS